MYGLNLVISQILPLIRKIIEGKAISLSYFNFNRYISYLEYNLKEKFGNEP
jgi:xanthosine utilization system XapX-like protein